jgi:hypothetical protein
MHKIEKIPDVPIWDAELILYKEESDSNYNKIYIIDTIDKYDAVLKEAKRINPNLDN